MLIFQASWPSRGQKQCPAAKPADSLSDGQAQLFCQVREHGEQKLVDDTRRLVTHGGRRCSRWAGGPFELNGLTDERVL